MRRERFCSSKSGSALLPVLLAMIAMAGMGAAVISTSLYRQSAARSVHEQERAFQAAMSGIDLALYEMQEGLDVDSGGVGNTAGTLKGGQFTASITPTFAGPGEYTLSSTGGFGPADHGIELVLTSESKFPYGVFGRDTFTMSGSYAIDSYDSQAGTYASQFAIDHAGENAAIGSNGDITAGGGTVWGDARPGPGMQVLGDPNNVTGSTAPALKATTLAPYLYAPAIASAGSLAGTTTLSSGSYRYDDLLLTGGEVLTLDGDIDLYIDGSITATDTSSIVVTSGSNVTLHHGAGTITVTGTGIVNQNELPDSLSLYSATTNEIELSGTADFHGLAYATEADFTANGAAGIFGVVVAANVTLSGSGMLHYDESMLMPAEFSKFRVKSARRVSTDNH